MRVFARTGSIGRGAARVSAAAIGLLALALPGGGVRAQGAPPHAWLFGSWTGGLYPAPTQLTAESCLAHPVVIFAQDIVLRATLTDVQFVQEVVATARETPRGVDIAFVPGGPPQEAGLMGLSGPPPVMGFGCASPNLLHVERRSANEISFPGCADFPNPLVRCPGG
jgi:hypothetical protein